MTLNEIKEHMSRNQFKTIANRCGYKCERPGDGDHGVDFHVHEVQLINRPQGARLFDTGRVLQFQLKATTEQSIQLEPTHLKYDLEVKTYNDLVDRAATTFPLTLVLAVLQQDQATWLEYASTSLTQQTQLFWYRPEPAAVAAMNVQKKRISIPLTNRVDLNFLDSQFMELFS